MSDAKTRTIGKLSLAALAIDFLFLTIIAQAIANGFSREAERYLEIDSDWLLLVLLPACIVIHAFVVEVVANGYSIGRLATGLTVASPGGSLSFAQRLRRFAATASSFGAQLFRPGQVARHNAGTTSWLVSDLVGAAESRPERQSANRPGDGGKGGQSSSWYVTVLTGAMQGERRDIASGWRFAEKRVFAIGRDPAWADLVLPDSTVSGQHCVIALRNGALYVRDWGANGRGSTHKTRIGSRVAAPGKWEPVADGESVALGAVAVRISRR